jgi:hypothetical protein
LVLCASFFPLCPGGSGAGDKFCWVVGRSSCCWG